MARFFLPVEPKATAVTGLMLIQDGRPVQETKIQPGDAIAVSYYGNGQVRISMRRGTTSLWFKIEPDDGLDSEMRNALRKGIYSVLGWLFPDSDVSGIFEHTRLLDDLFPGLHIVGLTQRGSSNTTATFVITGAEQKTQAA